MLQHTTFSIVAGTPACNASCPFCVSHMTIPDTGQLKDPEPEKYIRFRAACQYARDRGVSTALITGRGEPTLFPEQITLMLNTLAIYRFPIVELQTNALRFDKPHRDRIERHVDDWADRGLITVAISVVHWLPERNREIYCPTRKGYMDLPEVIDFLHGKGFTVRLAVVMVDSYVCDVPTTFEMIRFAQRNGVEQLTLRPVTVPEYDQNRGFAERIWAKQHQVSPANLAAIEEQLSPYPLIARLPYGARIYDVHGQNVCLTNCLTRDAKDDEITENVRSLIYFPDGHLRTSWELGGSIIF